MHLTWRTSLLVSAAAILALVSTPLSGWVAAADPITDLICSTGSASGSANCPVPAPLPAPAPEPAPGPVPEPAPEPGPEPEPTLPTEPAPAPPAVSFKNCTEAWNAGVAPLHRDDPGYAPKLDRDNDGVACEKDPR